MNETVRRGGLAGPMLLVGLGLVLLGNNLGWLNVSLWSVLFRGWPVILIAIGVDLLIPRRSWAAALLAAVLIGAVLVGGFVLTTSAFPGVVAGEAEAVTAPRGTAASADVEIRPAVGQLRLGAGAAGDAVLEGTIPLLRGERLERRVEQVGDTLEIDLRSQGGPIVVNVPSGGQPWDLRLNPSVPTDLTLALGVGEMTALAEGLDLGTVRAEIGVGRMELRLGRVTGPVQASVGVGQIVIVVPTGAAVRVHVDTGLASRSLPGGYLRDGDWYASPSYAGGSERFEIRLSAGIGEVVVREGR